MSTANTDRLLGAYLGPRDMVLDRTQTFLALAHRANDYEKELYYAREIGNLKGANARLVCAQAIVDVAVRHGQEIGDERYEIFSEATRSSLKSKRLDNLGLITLMADRLHTQIPLLTSLSEGQIPPQQILETAHSKSLDSIERIFKIWNKVKLTHMPDRHTTKGFMSETAASLLLERWAIENDVDGWVPTFTTLSDDHGNIINGGVKRGWDISIYTDNVSDPTHKLQVKTTYSISKEAKYEKPKIDFIPISKLILPQTDKQHDVVMPQYILGDFLLAAQGSETASDRLDERTEVLLDMFS